MPAPLIAAAAGLVGRAAGTKLAGTATRMFVGQQVGKAVGSLFQESDHQPAQQSISEAEQGRNGSFQSGYSRLLEGF